MVWYCSFSQTCNNTSSLGYLPPSVSTQGVPPISLQGIGRLSCNLSFSLHFYFSLFFCLSSSPYSPARSLGSVVGRSGWPALVLFLFYMNVPVVPLVLQDFDDTSSLGSPPYWVVYHPGSTSGDCIPFPCRE